MKYTYAYKTSDGTRHEATMVADSRDAVFAALRRQGIKAIKVVAGDGSKANGEIRGVRKRVVAALVVVAALIVGIAAFFVGESTQLPDSEEPAISAPRHQIYGDPAVLDSFDHGRFDEILSNKVDRMLAWFAQPGKLMVPKGTDVRRKADVFADVYELEKTGLTCFPIPETDSREVRELKQIVNGMHEEISAYLANGNGTPRSYWRRLIERTLQEMQIYERTKRELEKESNPNVREEKNEALRRLGLRTIPNEND